MEEINQYMPLSHDWNKERLETIKTMFPDIFTSEGKLNIDELKKLIDPRDINETERYEFRWFGKSQAKRNAFTPSNATLVYDEKRSFNPDKAENLIIEGENLEVLKLLSGAYREKIKCIYIDPPYNTGKDFVYSDNFTQDKKGYWEDAGVTEEGVKVDTNTEADGRYHSNWLNMMYSRLLVARTLLKPDGVIFISIDDNEVHNLRKLCDEVFGVENFLRELCWKRHAGGGNDSKYFAIDHEYILVYAKDINQIDKIRIPLDEDDKKEFTEKDEHFNTLGYYKTKSFRRMRPDDPRQGLQYNIECPDGTLLFDEWKWEEDRFKRGLEEKKVIIRKDNTGKWVVEYKIYLNNGDEDERTKVPRSLLIETERNSEGKKQLKSILQKNDIFNNPKPIGLLKMLINISNCQKGDIVLDFFGGSGSTGHAVFDLNRDDNKGINFILIQIPEATDKKGEAFKAGYSKISDITIDRNKRVIERILEENKTQQLGIFKNGESDNSLGFKVFKLTKSKFPRVEWTPEPDKTEADNIEALKRYIAEKEALLITMFNREELTTEILLKKGFNLNYKTQRQEQFKDNHVYLATDGNKQTYICLDAIMHENTVEYLKTNNDKLFICLERALDTTKKWNLKQCLAEKLHAF